MSVIRKVPFIKYLIDDLTAQQKTTLLDVINGEKDLVNASFANMPADAITPVLFKLSESDSKTGILILSSNYRVLICYHRFQDLLMIKFNSDNTYEKINEYLDINELRRLVEEADDHIVATEIDSGEADAGLVLTADGDGGASWENMSSVFTEDNVNEGDAVKLFGFDVQGNLVQDDIPEGIVVDDSIIEDSPNAVAGGAVYDALADIDAELDTKANVDGNYPTMTVGVADQLSPYDEESGDDQDEPFSFQATGTGNGTQPDFATGSIALMKEKQGNTVVVNQLAKELNTTNYTSIANCTISISNNEMTITDNGTTGSFNAGTVADSLPTSILGHKVLIQFDAILVDTDKYANIRVRYPTSSNYIGESLNTSNWTSLSVILNLVTVDSYRIGFQVLKSVNDVASTTSIKVRNIRFIDLTQWFNGDIPQDLLNNPSNFFRYYQGSLAHNTGELVNANGRYIKCIGMNQWDGLNITTGKQVDGTSGELSSKSDRNASDYIEIIPNANYYSTMTNIVSNCGYAFYDKDKNYITGGSNTLNGQFTTPYNAKYLRFTYQPTVYSIDNISINLYYEKSEGNPEPRCLTYEPYEVLTNNDTGTEVLRSAGSVHDVKTPDGTIIRNIGVCNPVDSLTTFYGYAQDQGICAWLGSLISDNSLVSKADAEVFCKDYLQVNSYAQMVATDKSIWVQSQGNIVIHDESLTVYGTAETKLKGLTVYVELAEPTTEQGTLFSENLVIDDFGSMSFEGTNGVPQGNLIFYPVDYKAFIDTLYNYTEGTSSNLALKSDISTVDSKADSIFAIMQENVGGALRHQLASANSLDFNNTAWVDLGELSWNYNAEYLIFYAMISNITSSGSNIISTIYKTINSTDSFGGNNMLIKIGGGGVQITNHSYTDATAFKNAMKGVLLAYEKAEE